MRHALLEVLRNTEGAGARVQLPWVWAGAQRWMAMPLGAENGELLCDGYLAGGPHGVAASMDVPAGISSDVVACLELFRNVPGGPNVGVGLYFPFDEEWAELAAAARWSPAQPFLMEHWARDPGHLDELVASVEQDPFFRLALGRHAEAVIVFDTNELEEIRLAV